MISYTSLILASVGTIWTILLISKMLVSKKKKAQEGVLKKIVSGMVPFTAKSYPKESMEYSFTQALKTLETFTQSGNFRYQLPWFMIMGPSDAGKTTFLKSLVLETPIDTEEFSSANSPCYWHFFNGGIFLDIKGSLIRKVGNSPTSDEANWFKTLDLIEKSRPERGLDGLVLCISAEDLYGPLAKTQAELMQDAEYIYAKLWQLQKALHLRVPIYVVVTHLDKIDGFKSFVGAMPMGYLQNMFGWSNPYSLENSFQQTWVHEMFDTLETRMEELQGEVFVRQADWMNAEMLQFTQNFRGLEEPLRVYLDRIFQNNVYAQSHFLRGVYFVGAQSAIQFNGASAEEKWPKLPGKVDTEWHHTKTSTTYAKHLFATDIIEKKVFVERNLSKMLAGVSTTQRRNTLLAQLGLGVGGMVALVYLVMAYTRLERDMNVLNPRLAKIVQMIKEGQHHRKVDDGTLMEEAQLLLNSIINISNLKMRYMFIPTSWISTLHYRVFDALEKSNDEIIVKAICAKIEEKYKELANYEVSTLPVLGISNLKNPLQHPTFKELYKYIAKMVELEKIQRMFDSASESGNLHSFAWLIKKLIGAEIPKQFYLTGKVLSTALKTNMFTVEHLRDYQTKMRSNAMALSKRFIDYGFVLHNFIENFTELTTLLYAFEQDNQSFTLSALKALQSQVANIITFANSEEFAWMQYNQFQLKQFVHMLEQMQYLPVLGEEHNEEFKHHVNMQFKALKTNMQAVKIPVVGSVFYVDAANMMKISDGMIELQGLLNTIFAEPFMQDCDERKLESIKYGQSVVWNVEKLNEISSIFASYDEFVNRKINSYPSHLKNMLGIVAKNNMERIVQMKLAEAQQLVPGEYSDANIIMIAENIKASYTVIGSILKRLRMLGVPLFGQLKEIEKVRSTQILRQADEMLDAQHLYALEAGDLDVDHFLKEKLYFGMNMMEYLTLQRGKITYFAKEVMDPVVKMLQLLNTFDSTSEDGAVRKWADIIHDVDAYTLNPVASHLTQLEAFFKQVEVLKDDVAKNILKENSQLQTRSENFFERRVVAIKRSLFGRINEFLSRTINEHCVKSMAFYKKYISFFPFNADGAVFSQEAYTEMEALLRVQSVELDLLRKIEPKIKNPNARFVEGMERIGKLMQYLMLPASAITITLKNPNELSEMYEQNLEYLVLASATSANVTVAFPDAGALKVSDRIIFRFKLANQGGMRFLADKAYQSTDFEATFTLGKKEFVRLLLKNTVVKGGQMILRFELPIMNEAGDRRMLVFAVPIELTQDSGATLLVPEQQINVLASGVRGG